MKFPISTVLGLAFVTSLAYAADINPSQKLPSDVVKFMEDRDICDHWRGEEPYDDERAKAIEEAWQASCPGTDKALALLRAKYKSNQAVLKALAGYEDKIE
jgi:hypothetical protein